MGGGRHNGKVGPDLEGHDDAVSLEIWTLKPRRTSLYPAFYTTPFTKKLIPKGSESLHSF